MKKQLLSVFILLTLICTSQANWPNTRRILNTAPRLANIASLKKYDLTTGKAIDSSLPNQPVIACSNIKTLKFRCDPGMNGIFELTIAHLSGGSFAPFKVYINDHFIGNSKNVKGKIKGITSTFKTPMLYSHGNTLKLETVNESSIGLIYINWKNVAHEKVPGNVWKTTLVKKHSDFTKPLDIEKKNEIGIPTQINGEKCTWQNNTDKMPVMPQAQSGTLVAMTHFHIPSCWVAINLKLKANNKASITVNGQTTATLKKGEKEKVLYVKGHKMLSGLNRIIIKMPAAKNAHFSLEASPEACNFIRDIPDKLNPQLNIDNWPKTEISNGKVSATIALPDPVKGFYRGPRFDHASMITELNYNGHTYFGINAGEVRNPVDVDQCAGVSEEFFEPIGFNEAQPGDSFIKLGVGLLRKPYSNSYFFGTSYWPVKFFNWTHKREKNKITFYQKINENGWGYDYSKKIEIPEGKKQLVITYKLKNTGKKQITTNQYAHNFIRIDDTPVGPDYTVKFKGRAKPVRPIPKDAVFKNGNTFILSSKTMFTPISGMKSINDNCVDIFLKDGTGITVSGDFTPFRYWLFSSSKVACPESFIHIDLAPGESKSWSRTYSLYSGQKQ